MNGVRFFEEDPRAPVGRAMIAALDRWFLEIYPREICRMTPAETLAERGVFFVARDSGGEPLGCGALMPLERGAMELKRIYVEPTQRGRGVGDLILRHLEAEAARRGARRVMLETGPLQPAAVALYEKHGYHERGPFADYVADELTLFFEKSLDAAAAA